MPAVFIMYQKLFLFDNSDSALTVNVGIFFANNAAENFNDVVDENLVVDHYAVEDNGVVLEHAEAVATTSAAMPLRM